MPDDSTELYKVQVEAKTAVQPDEAGGVADRLCPTSSWAPTM